MQAPSYEMKHMSVVYNLNKGKLAFKGIQEREKRWKVPFFWEREDEGGKARENIYWRKFWKVVTAQITTTVISFNFTVMRRKSANVFSFFC